MYIYYTKEGKFETEQVDDILWKKCHKLDGPAVICSDGHKEWMLNGKHHRLDGPAVITLNGEVGYFIDDKLLDTKEVETWIKDNNIDLKTKQHQVLFMLRFG